MKKIISAITTAFMVLAMQTFFVSDIQAAAPQAKPLPAKVQKSLADALAAITDFTNPAAVTAAVLAAIKASPSFAPEIVAFATEFVGGKLINDPAAAAKVIPAFVNAAVQAEPRLTTEIVGLAISAVPNALKTAVVPEIATEVMASAPNKKAKAEILNAALEATEGNKGVTKILDSIATQNEIKIANNDQGQQTTRYFVDDQGVGDLATGDQGTSTLGTFGGGASGGGGNPGNAGNSPTTNNTPAS